MPGTARHAVFAFGNLTTSNAHALSSFEASNLLDALWQLKREAPRLRIRNGGTHIVAAPPAGTQSLLDIRPLGFNHIVRVVDERHIKQTLTLGASVTLQALIAAGSTSNIPNDPLILLARAAAMQPVPAAATLAGAICTCGPSSPLVTALLACGAEIVLNQIGWNQRPETRVAQLMGFLSYKASLQRKGVLISELRMPAPVPPAPVPPVPEPFDTLRDVLLIDGPLCAAARYAMHNGEAVDCRVAIGGLAATPLRLTGLEQELQQANLAAILPAALDRALPPGPLRERARALVMRCFC